MKNTSSTTGIIFLATFLFVQHLVFAQAKPGAKDVKSGKSAVIHQEIDFKASPQKVYEALLSSTQFTEITGPPAQIDPVAGGAFSLFDKHIGGRNIELIPNQRIVQAWRAEDWPAGTYSIAKFEFKQQGTGTRLIFDHTGFPDGLADHLSTGWQANYWGNLTKYFDKVKTP